MSKYIYKQILIIGLIGAIVFSSRITEYPTEAATTKITYRIENKQQSEFLCNHGCDYLQGYYYYKPMSAEEFSKLLDK